MTTLSRQCSAFFNEKPVTQYFFLAVILIGLYVVSTSNYLLFHSLTELFSIVVGCSLFMIAWNARRFIQNQYLLFIGIAYLFIAFLDLLHTLSYKGMSIFTDYDYYANQLWIAARFMESITLLFAFLFLHQNRKVAPLPILFLYAGITAILIVSIFFWKSFPICFIEGIGLTPFKKISEYAICLILGLCVMLLVKTKGCFSPNIYKLLLLSLSCTIISELAFTFYISNYGISNLVGHYFKLFSFFFIYTAIIDTGINEPYSLIFKELQDSNRTLAQEVKMRQEKEAALQKALEEVKTLTGIIPICMYCKKMRDDSGYWQKVEEYIHSHSDVKFSHGLCPDCYTEQLAILKQKTGNV